jgi:fatty acid desaturase
LVAIALITMTQSWPVIFMYWIVPAFTWLKVCLRLRSIADHTGVQHREAPFDTRTIVPNLFDRIFLAPHHSSYHFGHHTYAAVPCYNLKNLHQLIMTADTDKQVHITEGFWGLLQEFPQDTAKMKLIEKTMGVSFTRNMPAES